MPVRTRDGSSCGVPGPGLVGEPITLAFVDDRVRTVVPVASREEETPSTVTLRFSYAPSARPGQFVMLWIPGDDEIPMSLSYTGELKGVTVKAMGATSRHIQSIRAGDRIGIRGPYGNVFNLHPRRVLAVGGGSGTAVLAPAVEAAIGGGSRVTVALGATTRSELLFSARLKAAGAEVHHATDDGTDGAPGFVTAVSARLLAERSWDAVWTCGPEVMMRKVADAARAARVLVSCAVERHMKCAMGLCDACAIGPWHVCIDGPVFAAERLLELPEFGRTKRDSAGRRVPH